MLEFEHAHNGKIMDFLLVATLLTELSMPTPIILKTTPDF